MDLEKQTRKKAMRQKLLELRRALGEEARAEKSQYIQNRFLALPEFRQAGQVMFFLNFNSEVATTELVEKALALGKKVALPRCTPGRVLLPLEVRDIEADTEAGTLGIREPKAGLFQIEPSALDLIVVPGVGFDRNGNRLGFGGGYYDRFLKKLRPSTPRVALAFACQVSEELPVEEFDERITLLVTEYEVCRFALEESDYARNRKN